MKTIDFSYFIERYNAGEMSEDEVKWFRKELEGNQKLREEVNLRKRTDEVLRKQDIISLREKLSAIEKSRQKKISIHKTKKKPAYLKYAAVVAVLVAIGTLAIFSDRNLSNDEILTRFYKEYAPPTAQRTGTLSTNADFTLALEYYNTHDYQQAASLFNKVLKNNPEDMQSALLKGVSNFEFKKYPEAKQSFVDVISDNNNLFIETAKWYLALCYVKTDEREKAIQHLEEIKSEGGIYKNDAKKIIRKLR
jgi:tetratricopeptide (TPR) repeat protein